MYEQPRGGRKSTNDGNELYIVFNEKGSSVSIDQATSQKSLNRKIISGNLEIAIIALFGTILPSFPPRAIFLNHQLIQHNTYYKK